jgi:hypothetical protein
MQRSVAPLAVALALTGAPVSAEVFDHLHCQTIKDPTARRQYGADLMPADASVPVVPGCVVKLPAKLLCAAVAPVNVSPPPPGAQPGSEPGRYLCYKVRCPKAPRVAAVADAFGARSVAVKASSLLCAPLPTPTTSTTTTTTTVDATSTTTTTDTSAPTTSTTLPPPGAAGCVLVNEVMTGGAASAAEEFVEVLNPCAHAVDLGGSRLVYRSAAGTSDLLLFAWPAGTSMPGGAHLVYGSATWTGPKDGELGAGLAAAGGGVAVRDPAGQRLDSVGWGTATNAFVEAAAAPAPAAGSSIGRLPDGADTDDNAADWEVTAGLTPGVPNVP